MILALAPQSAAIIGALLCAFTVSILLVVTKQRHGHLTLDSAAGIQRFHVEPTPRVGGIGIYLAVVLAWLLVSDKNVRHILGVVLIAGVPAFVFGLLEDLTKRVGVLTRLLATMASGIAAWLMTGTTLDRLEVYGLDWLMSVTPIAVLFTAFAIGGVANAINIIDGFHGLASGTSVIALIAIAAIAVGVGDIPLAVSCLLLSAAVVGFLLVNFPWGKLFMGDGGAYFVGFVIAWLSVLLVTRNPQVSVWAPLLVCAYPIIEVLYSMARRFRSMRSPGEADNAHLHSLIKTRFIAQKLPRQSKRVRNAAVSPIVWLFAAFPASLAGAIYQDSDMLAWATFGCLLLYHATYSYFGRGTSEFAPVGFAESSVFPANKIAIVGTVGVPASYGGFETLAENLVRAHQAKNLTSRVVVYCSAKNYVQRPRHYLGAELRYIGLKANGVSSVLYDIICLFSAIRHRCDSLLLLGVSGAIALPLVRIVSVARIVTNVDGIEWRREKWRGLSKWFLRLSEWMAVRFSHEIIADNAGIAQYISDTYGRKCRVIAYGGDHAIDVPARPFERQALPSRYALALCRIEPENNAEMILEAFAGWPQLDLVFIGNWNNSTFGQALKQRFGEMPSLHLLDPIYDVAVLHTIRSNATYYVHGHSAGGTNPSLVEMMHFGRPVLAFDCIFNRHATEEQAVFFKNVHGLKAALDALTPEASERVGSEMRHIAQRRYTWDIVATEYFAALDLDHAPERIVYGDAAVADA